MKKIFAASDEKITEKAFSQGLIISFLGIFLCIIALCSVTYAWFTTDLSSGNNVIESSRFALDIEVKDENGETVLVKDNENGTFTCSLEAVGTYTVVIEMTEDSTASKGFCDVIVNGTDKKQTNTISRDSEIGVNPFTFTVEATSINTDLTFVPKWGLPAEPEISNGGAFSEQEETVGGESTETTEESETVDSETTETTEQSETSDGETTVAPVQDETVNDESTEATEESETVDSETTEATEEGETSDGGAVE